MKKRILAILLVVALLTVAAVFTVQADAPLTKTEADAIIADVTSTLDTNTAFDATSDAGTVSAVCPYCGGEAKTWEPLPVLNSKPTYTADKHFYVPVQTEGEFETNGRYYLNSEGKTICIYLNGQTINDSISDTAAFMVGKGTMNFLGSGTVKAVASPGANKAGARGVLDVAGSAKGSTINVFGGTFESTGTAPTVTIRNQYTSAVNVYGGTIGSTEQTAETVRFIGGSNNSGGVFNLFDGTVNAGTGKSAIEFSTVNTYKAHGAEVNISGGTVNSGNVTGGGIYMDVAATVNMSGGLLANSGDKHTVYISDADAEFNLSGNGTINGGVHVDNEGCEISVDGTAVISSDNGGLDLTSGALLTLGDNLAAGADITVTVNEGVFTNENTNAAAIAAAGYIKDTVTAKAIRAVDNKLTLGTVVDAANAMSFTQDTTAVCPYCGTVESWTALSTSAGTVASGHYYLDPNATYSISTYYTVNSDVCLHLNGQNITSSGRVFWVNLPSGGSAFEMTVMGSGNVTGAGTASATATSNRGAVFDVSHNNSKNKTATPVLNLFGGTYATSNTSSILTMRTYFSGSTFYNWPTEVNMYGGELAGSETQVYASLMTLTGTATFNLHGGTITGGKAASTAGSIYSYAGKTVNKGKSTINMTGGTITGGNGKTGGNINLQAGSEFNMSGGLVTQGVASGNGGNIYATGASGNITTIDISGTAQITAGQAKGSAGGGGVYLSSNVTATMSGGTISGNSSTYSTSETEKCGGGNVTLSGTTMTMTGGEISGGISHFRGGNIYIRSTASSLTVSDDALISGGTAIDGGSISSIGTLEISGGTVQNGEASRYGGNIHAVTSGSLTISGDASITGGKATTRGGNIYIDEITAEMTGGTVTLGQPTEAGASTLRGGNVCVESGATFDMTGGTVSNGTAYNWGGNFNVSGTVNVSQASDETPTLISGGTITNASGYAGSIALMSSAAELNVSGGKITGDGTTVGARYGGLVTAYAGAINLSGDAIVEKGVSTTGANIHVYNGTLTLDGDAQVRDGKKYDGEELVLSASIYAPSTGTLLVKSSFTGNADLYVAEKDPAYTYGDVLEGPWTCEGDFEGSLRLHNVTGAYLIADDTTLKITGVVLYKDGEVVAGAASNADAITEFATGDYDFIRSYTDTVFNLTSTDVNYVIDLDGKDITVNGVEGAKFFAIDTEATFNGPSEGSATLGAGVINGVQYNYGLNNRIYIGLGNVVEGENVVTCHLLEMKVTGVSLRSSVGGIYYWTSLKCDSDLQAKIEESIAAGAGCYGLICNLETYPDLAANGGVMDENWLYTAMTTGIKFNGTEMTGAIMENVLEAGRTTMTNDVAGNYKIWGVPYIMIAEDTDFSGSDETFVIQATADNSASMSMYDIVSKLDAYIEENKTKLGDTEYARYVGILNEPKFNWTGYEFTTDEWVALKDSLQAKLAELNETAE